MQLRKENKRGEISERKREKRQRHTLRGAVGRKSPNKNLTLALYCGDPGGAHEI